MSKVEDILTITVSNDTITPDNLQAAKWFDKHTRLYAKRHYKRELANAKRHYKQQLLAEVLDMIKELHKNSASGSTTHDCSQDGYEYGLEDAIKAAKERFK